MTTLERAVAVWKRCREVEVGKCEECPLRYIVSKYSCEVACSMLEAINNSSKVAQELDKREAK